MVTPFLEWFNMSCLILLPCFRFRHSYYIIYSVSPHSVNSTGFRDVVHLESQCERQTINFKVRHSYLKLQKNGKA